MLGKGSIKKSPVDARNEKTEFENILFFNLFGVRSLEPTMTKLVKLVIRSQNSKLQAENGPQKIHRLD